MLLRQELHAGPLPPPEQLAKYEATVEPGLANRIVHMAESQSTHRQDLESRVVNGSERRATIGQWLGFLVIILCIVLGCGLVLKGHDVAGASIAGLAFAGGIAA